MNNKKQEKFSFKCIPASMSGKSPLHSVEFKLVLRGKCGPGNITDYSV